MCFTNPAFRITCVARELISHVARQLTFIVGVVCFVSVCVCVCVCVGSANIMKLTSIIHVGVASSRESCVGNIYSDHPSLDG